MELKDIFFNACRVNFDFLITEYGYQKVEETAEGYFYNYSFTNEVTRIEISFDGVEQCLDVILIRLINGLIPRRLRFEPREGFDYFSNAFPLRAVLELRCPEAVDEIAPPGPLYTEQDKEEMAELYRKRGYEIPDLSQYRRRIMLTPEETERRLERSAYYLKAYASDILQGDFSLFPQLNEIGQARKRVIDEEHKQTLERRAKAKAEKEGNGS